MAQVFLKDEDVYHQRQGPQGRSDNVRSNIYTVISRMPIEADMLIRYRIRSKSDNVERIVTEDQLSPIL
jgi:hypothetical protein